MSQKLFLNSTWLGNAIAPTQFSRIAVFVFLFFLFYVNMLLETFASPSIVFELEGDWIMFLLEISKS